MQRGRGVRNASTALTVAVVLCAGGATGALAAQLHTTTDGPTASAQPPAVVTHVTVVTERVAPTGPASAGAAPTGQARTSPTGTSPTRTQLRPPPTPPRPAPVTRAPVATTRAS